MLDYTAKKISNEEAEKDERYIRARAIIDKLSDALGDEECDQFVMIAVSNETMDGAITLVHGEGSLRALANVEMTIQSQIQEIIKNTPELRKALFAEALTMILGQAKGKENELVN